VIGAERSEQLDNVPAKVQVLAHIRRKYACPCCREHVVTAPLPAQPIPKSQASPGLLAHVAVSKYMDALPLHRQERIFQRMGIDMPRATLSQWMIRAGALVQPVINLLRDRLLEGEAIHCDETTLQVLKEPDKAASAISYMWVQVSGRYEPPVVLFDYDASRSGAIPKRLLGDFNGFLHTDGFEGYAADRPSTQRAVLRPLPDRTCAH
jgi:transposase